jgi:hypothetical protein
MYECMNVGMYESMNASLHKKKYFLAKAARVIRPCMCDLHVPVCMRYMLFACVELKKMYILVKDVLRKW